MPVQHVILHFSEAWVLLRHNEALLPIDLFISELRSRYPTGFSVKDADLFTCQIWISNAESESVLAESIGILTEAFPDSKPNGETPYELSITSHAAEKAEDDTHSVLGKDSQGESTHEHKKSKARKKDPFLDSLGLFSADDSTNRASSPDSALSRIEELIGADDFKELIREIHAVAPQLSKYQVQNTFTCRSYLFAINDGYGLSTYLQLFADFLSESRLVKLSSKKQVEIKIDAPSKDNDPLSDAVKALNSSRDSITIVCYDISEWMTKVSSPEFKRFLRKLTSYSDSYIFIFRVPFIEKDVLHNIQQSLADIMITHPVSFIPLDLEQLTCCAKKKLSSSGFTAEDDVWDVFATRINEEKSDGRFYGINTVHKVVNEMIYTKLVSNATSGEDNAHILRDEIKDLAHFVDSDYITADTMLDEMIGMSAVAARVREIIAQIVLANESDNLERPCLHMRFVGNPGTGKTTVARIVGKMLKENGILRNGQFFEYAGRDLVGSYVGHTAPKTAEICRDAYGSVLFIDEAYSLYRDTGKSSNDFGREALDTLIAEMENHRNDLVVIMAGYPDEMADLMKGNIGLESRMPYLIQFPNFTKEDLFQIFMQMVRRSFKYDEGFEAAARDFFYSIDDATLESKEFSNARLSRNLYERTWGKAAVRRQIDGSHRFMLIAEDLANAISDGEFSSMLEKRPNSHLGF